MLSQRTSYQSAIESHVQQVPWLGNLDHRALRIIPSTLAVLTTKAIFVNGFHHPLRLLLLHLLATLLWELILWISSRKTQHTSDAKDYTLYELARRANIFSRSGAKLGLRFACGIGALLCEYVAIYRFRSLPALSMLLLPDWSQIVHFVRHKDIAIAKKAAACLGCIVGVAMILVFEYQLSEVGLKSTGTAIFLGLAAQLLRQEPVALDDYEGTHSWIPIASARDRTLLLPLAIFVTMVAVYLREYLIYTPPLSKTLLAVLAVNTLAAVILFQYNGSYFRQTEPLATFNGIEEDLDDDDMQPFLEAVALQTVIALGSFMIDSSTVSIQQYIGFWIALITLLWVSRQFRSSAVSGANYTPIGVSPHNTEQRLPDYETVDMPKTRRDTEWSGSLQAIFLAVCILLSVSLILSSHTLPRPSSRWVPRHDHSDLSFNTTRSLDFVVSRYDESAAQVAQQINSLYALPSIGALASRLVVYSTNDNDTGGFTQDLQRLLHPTIDLVVSQHPNVGREAAAYLSHILSNYHNLSDHTFFLQAEMHSPNLIYPRLESYFVPQTGFLSLSDTHYQLNTCINQPWDHSTWSEDPGVLNAIYEQANITGCKDYALTYRGQFIVSRSRVLAQNKQLYSHLLHNLVDPDAVTHSEEYLKQPWLPSKQDSLNAPLFGFTTERIWGLAFGCEGKMDKCPSLVSSALRQSLGMGIKGDIGDCQCLDP
ncbi:unnamed protein product [Aureobasidium mustum]|uniref:Uncharacterized protein n=1 Tax=Aureobasidium mustum TaxID=2773714 RepID=A0A9N8PKG1_9PEZI|nr:unnamed protein product [Aureobasidium mustum]